MPSTLPDLGNANVGMHGNPVLRARPLGVRRGEREFQVGYPLGIPHLFCAPGERMILMKAVLTIAGSDPSGGAGIQADLKTMACLGLYGMSAVTALTAQNTTGVSGVLEADPEFVGAQLDAVFSDIRPQAVKIGMVSSAAIIRVIGDKLRQYRAEHIVVDPVMVATSGSALMRDEALDALTSVLLPLAEVVTPNLPEGERLTGQPIRAQADMEAAAAHLGRCLPGAVLLKGGHLADSADDLLWQHGRGTWFRAPRVDNPNQHGTGCTLSSALACFLALGLPLDQSVERAKAYLTAALEARLDLGAGSGPLWHNHAVAEGGGLL